jgi:hypothetical protein
MKILVILATCLAAFVFWVVNGITTMHDRQLQYDEIKAEIDMYTPTKPKEKQNG